MPIEAPRDARPGAARLLRRRVAMRPTWLPVTGPSMGRTIRGGSKVLVAASAEPRLGEIWAFCNAQGVLVVHRFAQHHEGAYYFQGDAHWPDAPVMREQLVGRVLRVRYRGRERRLGTMERVAGGIRLRLRRNVGALARRLGLRRLRDLAGPVLGRQ